MKNLSNALLQHLQSEVLTITTLLKLTRSDGKVFGFTEFSENITYQNLEYIAYIGQSNSNIKNTSNLSADNLEFTGALGKVESTNYDTLESIITEDDINAGLWDLCKVDLILINYEDLSMGHLYLKYGVLGQFKTGRTQFNAEIRSWKQFLKSGFGRTFTAGCTANFGDLSTCGLNINDFTHTGVVSKTINNWSWVDNTLNQTNSTKVFNITNIQVGETETILEVIGHNFSAGENVVISGIGTGNMKSLNNIKGVITIIDSDNIQLSINSLQYCEDILGSDPAAKLNSSYSYKWILPTYVGGVWILGVYDNIYLGGGKLSLQNDINVFRGGLVTWTSGKNKGYKMEVKNYLPNYIYLQQRMLFKIEEGDTYTITEGCDKTFARCKLFNNKDNFKGFNLTPGSDALINGFL